MRRRIVWLLPLLAGACLLGIVAADRGWAAAASSRALAATCGLLAPLLSRSPDVVAACALGLALALGAARLDERLTTAGEHLVRRSLDAGVEGRVCALETGPRWVRATLCDVSATAFGASERRPRVPSRVLWTESRAEPEGAWLAARSQNDGVRARLRLRPLGGLRNPGAKHPVAELRRRGIGARASAVDARLAAHRDDGTRATAALRRRLADRLTARGPGGALLAALALGDRSALGREARESFRRLGIGHLLAVSGLHLAMVAALAFGVGWRLAARVGPWVEARDVRVGARVSAAVLTSGYAVLAGWGVPVQRAFVFGLAAVAGSLLGRPRAGVHALAAAGLAVAVQEPAAVFEMGAQLSFCATAALLLDRWPSRGALGGLRVSATAIAATAPILAAHGMASSPLGVLANAVAVPWTAFVLLPAAILATGAAAVGTLADGLVAGLALIGEVSLGVVRTAAALLPVEAHSAAGTWGLALSTASSLAALAARRTSVRVVLAVAACGACSLAPPDLLGPLPPRLVVLDVGLGDAVIVEGREAAVLVDGGWALPDGVDLGRSVVVPALRALGVDRLAVVVATHADLDHLGGLSSVIDAVSVAEVWLPDGSPEPDDFRDLRAAAQRSGAPVRALDRSDAVRTVGDLSVEVLWPPDPKGEARRTRSRNDSSLVLAVTVEGRRVLLAGDVGAGVEAALRLSNVDLRADVLKVAHHGSGGSSTTAFLEAVAPRIALVSAPCSPRSRLPTRDVLRRLERAGAQTGWTGRDGALFVALRAGAVGLEAWQPDPACQAP